jgi:predicted dehydrogenase
MRFALLGDHPDALEMARALVGSGRHEVTTYTGPGVGAEYLRRWGIRSTPIRDLEEVLADPAIEAVIVAGAAADRAFQLRRALQSERHVLCVHPADDTPDIAYEAAMIQGDTRCVLLPLLPQALHPGIRRLAELARDEKVLGSLGLVEADFHSSGEFLLDTDATGHKVSLPGWDVLRTVGGEIAELSAFAAGESLTAQEPVLLTGRFERGGLLQGAFLPDQHDARWRLNVIGSYSRAALVFAEGWPGPAQLRWQDESGTPREEKWEAWNPWPAVVAIFEASVALHRQPADEESSSVPPPTPGGVLTWQSAIRALELDDAARRSLSRRRVSTLEYPEPTEEVGFKGTMTLVGCGLLWTILVLAILASWFPWLGWAIVPVLFFFLGLQVLRWLVPASPKQAETPASERTHSQDAKEGARASE